MKKLFNFRLLVLIGVLITSIGTVQAKKVYLIPGVWTTNGDDGETPSFWVHAWGSEEQDVKMSLVEGEDYTIYQAEVADGNTNYIFARNVSTATETFPSSGQYNKTNDITGNSNNRCEITGWDKSHYSMNGNVTTEKVYYTSAATKVEVNVARVNNNGSGESWKLVTMTDTGKRYDGNKLYEGSFLVFWGGLARLQFRNDNVYTDMIISSWTNSSTYNGKLYHSSAWRTYEYDHVIKSGSTIVWDLGNESDGYWPANSTFLYRSHYVASAEHDALTKISSSNQRYKTYNADTYCKALLFRNRSDGTWDSYRQTTDITGETCDIDGITLFTYPNSATKTGDNFYKLDWQVVSPAYKGTSGATVYFDNTDAGFEDPYLKWGTDWYNRAGDMDVVPGTNDKLYKYTFPDDVYYGEFIVSDGYGYTNDYYCTERACTYYTAFQNANVSTATTLIPSEKAAEATTAVLSGYERSVSISSYSNGTVTVSYTDINGDSQDETSGNFNVQQACVITVTATADNGYDLTGLTVGGSAFTSGNTYAVRGTTAVAATFTAHTYNITLNKGDHGAANGSATVVFNTSALATSSLVSANAGYTLDGFYDGETKVLNADGSFAAENVTGYITGNKWSKYNEDATLTAKFTPKTMEFAANDGNNWSTTGNWTDEILPTLEHPVVISDPVTVDDEETMALAASVTFSDDGTLTIESTGALKVAGTITNSTASNIVIEPSGALIFNSTGTTQATVELSTGEAGNGNYQYIAIPVSYVDVKDAFGGEGIYTYVWSESKGWERRGYYDGLSAFEAVALTGSSGTTFRGALVSTADKVHTLTYTAEATYGETSIKGMNMFGNSWTAPIEVSGITFEGCESAAHVCDGSTGTWSGVVSGDVIPAMQAFGVLANSGVGTKTVTIPYSAVRGTDNPNEPLKAPKRTTSDLSEPIAIYVTGNEMKTRIRFFENAQFSDKIDNGFEAVHIDGEGRAGELYAQAEEKMNVLATDNLEGTVVGFIPGEATNYTISFAGDGRGYYLNDIKTEQSTLIEEGNTYDFTPGEGDNSARFVISKTPMSPTGTETISDGSKARKQMINGQLLIIRDGRIYGVDGRLVK